MTAGGAPEQIKHLVDCGAVPPLYELLRTHDYDIVLGALEAIQTLGGNGYINDYPTGRLLRDAKLYEIGAGTSEIRRMLIGRELFNDTV